MRPEATVEVVRADGVAEPLSRFLTRLLKGGGLSVSEVSRRSGLSRSYLYVLMDENQTPTTEALIALLDAAGCEAVRPAGAWDDAEIAFKWAGGAHLVRYPPSDRRSTRARNAMRSLKRGSDSWASPVDDQPLEVFGVQASAAAAGAEYDMRAGGRRTAANERQLLLGQLLEAAGGLDEDRIRLLVEHARILGRS